MVNIQYVSSYLLNTDAKLKRWSKFNFKRIRFLQFFRLELVYFFLLKRNYVWQNMRCDINLLAGVLHALHCLGEQDVA
jgi:hypothetical protein